MLARIRKRKCVCLIWKLAYLYPVRQQAENYIQFIACLYYSRILRRNEIPTCVHYHSFLSFGALVVLGEKNENWKPDARVKFVFGRSTDSMLLTVAFAHHRNALLEIFTMTRSQGSSCLFLVKSRPQNDNRSDIWYRSACYVYSWEQRHWVSSEFSITHQNAIEKNLLKILTRRHLR